MSSKAKRPTELERLVRVRDVFPIIEYVRDLETRIKTLEMQHQAAIAEPVFPAWAAEATKGAVRVELVGDPDAEI